MSRIFHPTRAMLWTQCVRHQEKFPRFLAHAEIAMIMVSSAHSGLYLDSIFETFGLILKCIRPNDILGTSYGTSGLGTEPHSLTSSESYSLEDLSRGLRMPSTEACKYHRWPQKCHVFWKFTFSEWWFEWYEFRLSNPPKRRKYQPGSDRLESPKNAPTPNRY